MALSLKLNGKTHTIDAEPGTPLLWVIRDELQLTGTKFGCGVASCGACTVHLDGVPVRSCQTYVEDVEDAEITTIEAMAEDRPDDLARAYATALEVGRRWREHIGNSLKRMSETKVMLESLGA